MLFVKTDLSVCVCEGHKPSQMLVSVGIGGVHLAVLLSRTRSELWLCPNANPQEPVGHPLVFGFTLDTAQLTHEKPGHLRGEAACLVDSRSC